MKFKVLIIGDGVLGAELKKMSKEKKIEDYIEFYGNVKEINKVLPLIDVGISTSIREGLSNSIIEMLICGIKVIVTNIGANKELVDNKEYGDFFEVGNYVELANIMQEYIERDRKTYIAKVEVNKIREKFDRKRMIKEYEQYY